MYYSSALIFLCFAVACCLHSYTSALLYTSLPAPCLPFGRILCHASVDAIILTKEQEIELKLLIASIRFDHTSFAA